MRIIQWLIRKRLERQVKAQARRLSEIRSNLRKLQARRPQFRLMVQPELTRLAELAKQLRKVKNREELQLWSSRFAMCLPTLRVVLDIVQELPETRKKRRKGSRK
ncbi:hypothetical protein ACFLUD_04085 [Chloroflexota bacterium]